MNHVNKPSKMLLRIPSAATDYMCPGAECMYRSGLIKNETRAIPLGWACCLIHHDSQLLHSAIPKHEQPNEKPSMSGSEIYYVDFPSYRRLRVTIAASRPRRLVKQQERPLTGMRCGCNRFPLANSVDSDPDIAGSR